MAIGFAARGLGFSDTRTNPGEPRNTRDGSRLWGTVVKKLSSTARFTLPIKAQFPCIYKAAPIF
jgi:hypothetical protein